MSSIPGYGWSSNAGVFQLGRGKTLAVDLHLHQANRAKLIQIMNAKGITQGIAFIKGGDEAMRYDSDTEILFQQDSWFQYLFGVKEPNFSGVIHVSSGKAVLFIPKLPIEYEVVCGKILPPAYYKDHYLVDDVLYTDDIASYLIKALPEEGGDLHALEGLNTDSGTVLKPHTIAGLDESIKIETSYLHHALATSRTVKSSDEITILRYTNYVASMAHVEVMRFANANMHEYELEAKFLYEIYSKGGCRHAAYTSICACGPNAAVLHYGHAAAPNDRMLLSSDIALLDMGAAYHGYASDITCSFPVSGKFTDDQRAIYEGVLAAQIAVLKIAKPGVSWSYCHQIAQEEILKALINIGILSGTPAELAEKNIGAIFFPHGLGHLIGLDTHDVGGYLEGTPSRSQLPGFKKLRTARVLEEGFVLTNEPGCYFIDVLLNAALQNPQQAPHINQSVLSRFRGFGGVRLEDDIVITADGAENLTLCPRTVQEVESVLAGGVWPPLKDEAPYLKRKWGKLSESCRSFEDIVIS